MALRPILGTFSGTRNCARAEDAAVDADIQIEERKQAIVQVGEIDSNRATRNNLVRTRLPLGKGDFLDLEKTNRSRRSLDDTCAYS
jgi:outer membrane protein assembly factor BamA